MSIAPRPCFPAALLSLGLIVGCGGGATEAAESESGSAAAESTSSPETVQADSLYTLELRDLAGNDASLSDFQGKVTLVVNTASECGYTPQYAGLQELHEEFRDRGFSVVGFPSNDFGGQEPGTPEEIREFCDTRYGVTFPLYEKVVTKAGEAQSPVYRKLEAMTGELPSWNFCKYLVGKDGKSATFYASKVAPDSEELRTAIESALAES